MIPISTTRLPAPSPPRASALGVRAPTPAVGWTPHFTERFGGQPFKTVAISFTDSEGRSFSRRGEFVATATGVEGSLVYAVSQLLRDEIEAHGHATFHLDLLPDHTPERVLVEVRHPRGSRSLSSHLKSRLGLDGIKAGILYEHLGMDGMADPVALAHAIKALPGTYKPQARAIVLEPGRPTRIADVDVTPVPVPHGPVTVFAYRIGALAYVTDAKCVPADAVAVLRGARVLVVNALFQDPHPSHLSFGEALQVAKEVGAGRTYLTHLTHESSHAALAARLPAGVEPAYDGLQITI